MPVFDAALDAGTDMIHFRHEAAAVHTADAWGRLTGEPGVALVTAGPGFSNTLTALYVAMAAESPVVLLSGHAPLSDLGRGGFQEMPQADMAGQVSKASWTAGSPAGLGHDVARALSIARSGRPGPVHVALPFDVLEASVPDDGAPPVAEAAAVDTGPPTESDIGGILGALRSARRPVVLPGQAISRAGGKALANLSNRDRPAGRRHGEPQGDQRPKPRRFRRNAGRGRSARAPGQEARLWPQVRRKPGRIPQLQDRSRRPRTDRPGADPPGPRGLRQAGGRRSCRSGIGGGVPGVRRNQERRRRMVGRGTFSPVLRTA